MRNCIPRVVLIHDISGLGRTSLTAAMPVLSSMGLQPIPLPTAILSTQTVGFNNFSFLDLTDNMTSMLTHWESLGEKFDSVYSGFMACPKQMDSVARCIEFSLCDGGLVVIDPVLGEDGHLIPTMTAPMVSKMRWLIRKANIITPNYTEICLLLDESYAKAPSTERLKTYLKTLSDMGPEIVVGTSLPMAKNSAGELEYSSVLAYERNTNVFWRVNCTYIPAQYPGTGDIFASVLTGSLLLGDSLSLAIDKAVQFVTLCVRATFGQDVQARDGILLERYLGSLRQPLTYCQCSID